MRPGFDEWMLEITNAVAKRSRDPSTKVGCVITRRDKSICSVGYNGFPRHMVDIEEWWLSRVEKYDRVIHAEMNAILAAKEPLFGHTLYVNRPTCKDCAKHIIAAQIRVVVWPDKSMVPETSKWYGSIQKAIELYRDSGVTLRNV